MTNKPKRPRDVTVGAVFDMMRLIGEIEEQTPVDSDKDPAAVAMGIVRSL